MRSPFFVNAIFYLPNHSAKTGKDKIPLYMDITALSQKHLATYLPHAEICLKTLHILDNKPDLSFDKQWKNLGNRITSDLYRNGDRFFVD